MRILFAYDGSEPAEAALRDLPRAGIPGGSTISVLTVEEPSHSLVEFDLTAVTRHYGRGIDLRRIAREGQEKLALLMSDALISSMTAVGPPDDVITEMARELDADLVVVGSGADTLLGHLHLGSTFPKVLRHSDRSVRVGRSPREGWAHGPVRIVVGVDGSAEGHAALREVGRRQWPAASEVWLVTAIEADRTSADLQEDRLDVARLHRHYAGELASRPLAVRSVIRDGDACGVLLSVVDEVDAETVFLGTHGLGGLFERLLGCTATSVAEHAPCSVEVVKRRGVQGG